LNGSIVARNGLAVGNMGTSWRKQLTPTMNAEVGVNIGNAPHVNLQAFRSFGPFLYV
jgi:hypothetical protein